MPSLDETAAQATQAPHTGPQVDTKSAAAKAPKDGQVERGWSAPLTTDVERAIAMEFAFDYRGDVTLRLTNGEEIVGYLFNRDTEADPPFAELFPKGNDSVRRVYYEEVLELIFTGTDTAAGKSWDTWLVKMEEAKASGKIAELYPDEIDD